MTASALHPSSSPAGQHVILYDGICGLCNRVNQFVISRDSRSVFDFASLQSETGRSLVKRFGREPDDLDTFYVVTNYRAGSSALLSKAEAALFIVKTLGAPWSWLGVFGILPKVLLNWSYDTIARNRYRLFGRFDTCPIPRPAERRRFIDI
jgi:predicted DCC family thiol-disulfide oxidoreductase YuxK